jgi:hypothetical protein
MLRGALTAVIVPALIAGVAAAAPQSPARAAAPRSHQARLTTAPGPLTPGQAEERADATGKPVTVSALTTPTSSTTVSPGEKYTVTETSQPTRAWRDHRWQALNPALHANANGTISPAVTTGGLTLSGGGTGPFAVIKTGGRSLSLFWPRRLPAPTISGATATYAGVLTGVDLVVTADDQGGVAETIVIHNAAAAANPALASIKLTYATTGLSLTADAAGNLTARVDPAAPAAITAQAPLVWDSTPPPAGMATVTGPGGTLVDAKSGLPAYSSVSAPGSAAHVATVPVTLSGNTITLTPPASALTGPGRTYPVYVDPTWHNTAGSNVAAWTQADSGFPTTSYWNESSDLQVGECPTSITPPSQGCNGLGVARSFIRMPIPSALTKTALVHSADLYMDEVWAPSCTAEPVNLYTTYGISSATTWNKQPGLTSSAMTQNAAFGYPGCGSYKNDITWNVTSTVASDAAAGQSTQTWSLRAGSESAQLDWKQFQYGKTYFTLSAVYNYPPNKPDRTTSPGGACYYGASGAPVIGNDDVTFNASASDNDGDNDLTTRFIILNANGSTAYDSAAKGTSVTTGDNGLAELPLTRSVMQSLNSGGTTQEFTYHWYAIVTDDFGLSSPAPADECYFTYNPLGPAAPTVTIPASGTLGQQVAATFTAPAGCSATGNPCPVSYSYQLGASPPVTVTDNSGSNWTGNITINQVGPIEVTVTGIASGGNPGQGTSAEIQGNPPATPYADGHFTGGTYPDLLTIGTGSKPSLWLSTGSGNGALNPAVDIGSLGTTINPGTDGPGDWAGAIVLHGEFTVPADNVQDVMAYYPSGAQQGNGIIIAGNGNGSSLQPSTINVSDVNATLMQNPVTGAFPVQLVAAGNASGLGAGTDDLIGISGNSTSPNNYELDLFTNGLCAGCAQVGGYGWDETLTITAPDGTSDWNNYTVATAGNPASTVLFALDAATGALYECTSPAALAAGTGTWTRITVPWGSSPPELASGDINHAGQTELWTLSGKTATAYSLSGTTLTAETSGASVAGPSNDWPLTDGSALAESGTATTAVDTITGNTAALSASGTAWTGDDYFNTDVSTLGNGYLTPPAATVPDTDTTPSISVWFKTSTAAGVLVSLQKQAVSAGTTSTGNFDPVMYIGTDGKLNADFWPVAHLVSANPVDDGLWHHAVLTVSNGTQTLQLDGQVQGTASGSPTLTFANPTNLTFGTGYVGGVWPDEPHYQQSGNTGYLDYFTGEIADITFTQ